MLKNLKSLFGKKNIELQESKPMKNSLTDSEKKWNKLWDMYANEEWDNPIFYLCDYYSGINGGGHLCFLDNKENELKTYCAELQKVMSERMYAKFYQAYQAFMTGDEEQIETVCNSADDYFYQHEEELTAILQQYADSLDL